MNFSRQPVRRVLRTREKRIPIGEATVDENGAYSIIFKKHGEAVKESVPLDDLFTMVYESVRSQKYAVTSAEREDTHEF